MVELPLKYLGLAATSQVRQHLRPPNNNIRRVEPSGGVGGVGGDDE